MKITDMNLTPAEKEDPYAAVITMELDHALRINGILLYQTTDEEYFLQFPYLTMEDGSVREICYPTGKELTSDIYLKAVNLYVLSKRESGH